MRIFIFALLAVVLSRTAVALPIDYKLYLRTPAGTNAQGGKQYGLNNPGSRGNEFRLGNETTYAEAYFNVHVLEAKDPGAEFFDTNLTFAYNPQMNSQYGDTTANTDYTQVIQAFVKGGNFDGVKAAFWAGKRFYRDVDLHLDDFFYFADMSGVGGGVEAIHLFNGNLAIAIMQHSDVSLQKTTNGVPTKNAIDIRWRDIKIGSDDTLHLWVAAGYTPPGTGYANDGLGNYNVLTNYEASSGVAVGERWHHIFTDKSYNDFTVMYGTGAMENFTMDGSYAYATNGKFLNRRRRTRVVEAPVFEIADKLGMQIGLVYEGAETGVANPGRSQWLSVGLRPIYYFTDHFHLAFEAGFSDVKSESDVDAAGAKLGDRALTRLTLAPEMAIGKGYFARPVIRAYVTHSMWNAANADTAASSNSMISVLNKSGITALDGHRDVTQFGFQGEVWF